MKQFMAYEMFMKISFMNTEFIYRLLSLIEIMNTSVYNQFINVWFNQFLFKYKV